jgi:hypothetical protein
MFGKKGIIPVSFVSFHKERKKKEKEGDVSSFHM